MSNHTSTPKPPEEDGMSAYSCPSCTYTGQPADVENAAIVDGWIVTCANCGTTTIQDVAFASALLEEHREEVRR